MAKTALIVLSGEATDSDFEIAGKHDYSIAVDGGIRHFIKRNIKPNLHLGDFDSTDDGMFDFVQANSIESLRYPKEKNESDGELAISYARLNGFKKAVLVGLSSLDRPDHTMFNIGLIRFGNDLGIETVAISGGFEIFEITGRISVNSNPGMVFSVMSQDKPCNVRLDGLKYPLDGELKPGSTLGLSNVTLGNFSVLTDGRLLAFLQKK